jgi:hypothetical protein
VTVSRLVSTGPLLVASSATSTAEAAVGSVSIGARTELSPISTGSGWVSMCATAVCSVGISATNPTGSNRCIVSPIISTGISRPSIMWIAGVSGTSATTGGHSIATAGGDATASLTMSWTIWTTGGLSIVPSVCAVAVAGPGDADGSLLVIMGVVLPLPSGLTPLPNAADAAVVLGVANPSTLSPMAPTTDLFAASSSSSIKGLTST